MPCKPIDWQSLASTHNYSNAVDMISDWYYNHDTSIENMAFKLSVSTTSLRRFMLQNDIHIRTDKMRQKAAWRASMRYYVRNRGNLSKNE